MELSDLGFDRWFADQARERCDPELSVARVTAVDRGRYVVRDENGEVPAELTGRYLHEAAGAEDVPCVGDWVCVSLLDARSHATIHGLLPRRSCLRRKSPGRGVEFQMIAANIDVAFIVQACHFDFNLRRLERYLVMVREGRIRPVVLLTKTDLVGPEVLEDLLASARRAASGVPVVAVSNVTGAGLDEVRRFLCPGETCCLLGSSGVGKTTLINQLTGSAALETSSVSHTGEGRHTTTRRQLVVLEDGRLLIDMPGMRELGLLGAGESLEEVFADVGELAANCRFADCTHAREPGCAVRAAIERGDLAEDHLQSYHKLRRESAYHDMSYVERRRKDREFGRMVRAVLKPKGGRDPL
jgi:ribosome biogenesis GTPase